MEKECTKCGEVKALDNFGFHKDCKDNLKSTCRQCNREVAREHKLKYPNRFLLTKAKGRAKKFGIPFDLTKEDIIVPDICPVFNKPLVFGYGNGRNPMSPSLDRIDNTKGYVKGNVIVVSWRANHLKNDATIDELETLTNFYKTILK